MKSIEVLRDELRRFVDDRDWAQFHNPKNLSMALSAEAAEVLEHFLWASGEATYSLPQAKRDAVAEELADVLIYLVRLGDVLDIDLLDAAALKIRKNRERYPANKVRGRAVKYDELWAGAIGTGAARLCISGLGLPIRTGLIISRRSNRQR